MVPLAKVFKFFHTTRYDVFDKVSQDLWPSDFPLAYRILGQVFFLSIGLHDAWPSVFPLAYRMLGQVFFFFIGLHDAWPSVFPFAYRMLGQVFFHWPTGCLAKCFSIGLQDPRESVSHWSTESWAVFLLFLRS